MKLFRHMATAAILTFSLFTAVTYTACTKDQCSGVTCNNGGTCSGGTCTCPTGVEGVSCDTLLKSIYAGTYKGNGTDNAGGTYTGWGLVFAPTTGTVLTTMSLTVVDASTAPQLNFTVTLSSNTTFTVNPSTSGSYSYTGSGTINGSTASLSLTEVSTGGTTTVYSFNNFIIQ